MSRVVVTDHAFSGVARERAAAQSAGAAFSEHQCRSEAETLEAVEGANVVFNNFAPMNARTMGVMAKGATVIRYGVGVDNVDLPAAKKLGIHVCNVPDYGVEEVADHASAMALSLDDFVITFFLIGGGNTLPTLVWGMLRTGLDPSINALGTLILLLTIGSSALALRLTRYRG